ncbi:thiamine-phosphate kinase [Moraxella marmotae]|uniref:thiamine-phosphate kinase n=1 Tax=Moraxella marmotae TaxID=3344520 RepID=UPI0035F24BDA
MSEFALIQQHFANATLSHPDTVLGIGDDCAVSQPPAGCQLVSCMDTLVAGRHFLVDTPAYAIAYKAVAVNLSDLAAMGATPYAILLGLNLPKSLANDAWLGEFCRGLAAICQPFGVELIGGDTTGSEILTISITALGFIEQNQAITRHGAKVGDLVCVSGEIGSASFALSQAFLGVVSPLKHTLDLPMPQVHLGRQLVGYASAMIDISDGLAQDLGHILSASGVGAVLDLDKLPTHPILQKLPDTKRWQHQLNGGDDYQLCLTISPQNLQKFQQNHSDSIIYPIGHITKEPTLMLTAQNRPIDFDIGGWQHF